MTVIFVDEDRNGRQGEQTRDETSYERVFIVRTDNKNDMAVTAMTASYLGVSVPRLGEPYPEDSSSFVSRVFPKQRQDDPYEWRIQITYSSIAPDDSTSPLDEPASITWGGEAHQKAFVQDLDGKAVCNSAGDPYDPPIAVDDSRTSVRWTKNFSPASLPDPEVYRDVVNSDAITIDGKPYAAGKAKIKWLEIGEVQTQKVGETEVSYRTVSANILLKDDGWLVTALDAGYREISFVSADLRRDIVTEEGKALSSPALLDGNGRQLTNPSQSNAVVLEWRGCRTIPFSSLGIS